MCRRWCASDLGIPTIETEAIVPPLHQELHFSKDEINVQFIVPRKYTARRFCVTAHDERMRGCEQPFLISRLPMCHLHIESPPLPPPPPPQKNLGVGMFVTLVLETHLHFSHSKNEYCVTIFMHLSLSALNVFSNFNMDLRSTTQYMYFFYASYKSSEEMGRTTTDYFRSVLIITDYY